MTGRACALTAALLLGACSRAAPRPPDRGLSTTVPPPSTSTTSAVTALATVGLAATDRLERGHRLALALPHATAHYRIDFAVAADGRLALRVTLLAVLNDASDLGAYQADLRRYRAEALAFIEAQGDDPATYTVTFLPEPTTQ